VLILANLISENFAATVCLALRVPRPHIHVRSPDGECKFWLEPVLLASNRNLKPHTVREIEKLVYANLNFLKESYHEFHNA